MIFPRLDENDLERMQRATPTTEIVEALVHEVRVLRDLVEAHESEIDDLRRREAILDAV